MATARSYLVEHDEIGHAVRGRRRLVNVHPVQNPAQECCAGGYTEELVSRLLSDDIAAALRWKSLPVPRLSQQWSGGARTVRYSLHSGPTPADFSLFSRPVNHRPFPRAGPGQEPIKLAGVKVQNRGTFGTLLSKRNGFQMFCPKAEAPARRAGNLALPLWSSGGVYTVSGPARITAGRESAWTGRANILRLLEDYWSHQQRFRKYKQKHFTGTRETVALRGEAEECFSCRIDKKFQGQRSTSTITTPSNLSRPHHNTGKHCRVHKARPESGRYTSATLLNWDALTEQLDQKWQYTELESGRAEFSAFEDYNNVVCGPPLAPGYTPVRAQPYYHKIARGTSL
ncbi:hypothetical protein Bbelb_011490 [Branchiostoma belcheri]|nr:hypothetical protein Bbelb_011490 [Branchiostoma belcheri]